MIIAGDIGGTKCNLAAYLDHGGALKLVSKQRYATRDFSSFEQLIETFAEHALPSVPNRAVTAAIPGARSFSPGRTLKLAYASSERSVAPEGSQCHSTSRGKNRAW